MATKPYRFQLAVRPTIIGNEITERLEAQGVDRAAEGRRWLELGFAAEQAGFRLDGTVLKYADRAWDMQVSSPALPDAGHAISSPASSSQPPAAPSAPAAAGEQTDPVSAPTSVVHDPSQSPLSSSTSAASSRLLSGLRGLSVES